MRDAPDLPFRRLALAAFALLSILSCARHATFHSATYDLGIFHQTIWNTSRGHWFASSLKGMSYLGDHFSPSLALFAPLAWLPWSAYALVVAQAALGVSVGVAMHRLALDAGLDAWIARAIGAATLAHPAIFYPAIFDFHPEFLEAAAIAWALVAWHRQQRAAASALLFVAIGAKEDAALALLGLGLSVVAARGLLVTTSGIEDGARSSRDTAELMSRQRRRDTVLAGALIVASLAWFAFVFGVASPHFRPPLTAEQATRGWYYGERFRHLGDSPRAVARFVALHPLTAIVRSASWAKLLTIGVMIGGFGFLPLGAARALVAVVPLAAAHFLAVHAGEFTWKFQYLVPLVPLLGRAAIATALAREAKPRQLEIASGVAIAIGLAFGVLPRVIDDAYFPRREHSALAAAVAAIPSDASACSLNRAGPHLSGRAQLDLCVLWEPARTQYEFYGWPTTSRARYQLFDLNDAIDEGAPSASARVAALRRAGAKVLVDRDGVTLFEVDDVALARAAEAAK